MAHSTAPKLRALAAAAAVGALELHPVSAWWHPVGVWEHVVPQHDPQGNILSPLIQLFPNGLVADGGGLFAAGRALLNTTDGDVETYAFDTQSYVWSRVASPGADFSTQHLLSNSGLLVAIGGAKENAYGSSLFFRPVSAGGANANWTSVPVGGAPLPTDGARAVMFGGRAYLIGGLVRDATPYFTNGVLGLDFAGYIASSNPTKALSWTTLTSAGSGVWDARAGMSVNVWADKVVLYGGLTFAASASSPSLAAKNVCEDPAAGCKTFSDVWTWAPGLPTGPLGPCPGGAGDCGWEGMASGGLGVPPGRYDHASGILGDSLFIFGGISNTGAYLTDLWAYCLTHEEWHQVKSQWVGEDTGFGMQLFPPAAAFSGHRFYAMLTGPEGEQALYKWVPITLPTAAPTPPPPPQPQADTGAHTAAAFAAVFSAFNAAILGFMAYQAWRRHRSRRLIAAADAGTLYSHLQLYQDDPIAAGGTAAA